MPDADYGSAVAGVAAASAGLAADGAGLAADGEAVTLWRRLGRAGLIRGLFREAPRGLEVEPARLDDLLTELDAVLPPGLVLSVCVQAASAVPILAGLAPDSALAGRVLGSALRGEAIVALAATDAGLSGSALLDSRTELADGPAGPTLTGSKEWITNAGHCDYALVLARHGPARHFTSFSWVLVAAGQPGVSCEPAATGLFPGAALGQLSFAQVRLSGPDLVGRRGRALAEFARHVSTERLAGSLWARALCRRVLAGTHQYLQHRPAGEDALWANAAVRERFARCLVEWRRLDALCSDHQSRAAAGQRTHASALAEAMALKAAYAESAERILSECVSLRGADSFRDGGLARLREQAAMFGIAGGATGAMLAGVADHADEFLGGRR